MTMVVGVFESLVNAEDAVADLVASGYPRRDIEVLVRDGPFRSEREDVGGSPAPAQGASAGFDTIRTSRLSAEVPPGKTEAVGELKLATALEISGLEPVAARFFADAICNGAVLVAVRCAAPRASNARDILDVFNDSDGGPPVAQRRTLM